MRPLEPSPRHSLQCYDRFPVYARCKRVSAPILGFLADELWHVGLLNAGEWKDTIGLKWPYPRYKGWFGHAIESTCLKRDYEVINDLFPVWASAQTGLSQDAGTYDMGMIWIWIRSRGLQDQIFGWRMLGWNSTIQTIQSPKLGLQGCPKSIKKRGPPNSLSSSTRWSLYIIKPKQVTGNMGC